MKRRGFLLGAAALLGLAGAAEARMHAPYRGHRIIPQAAPLDGFTTPSGAYSFRKLRSAYAGPAIRIRRASDNAETDIGFLGFTGFTGAPWDVAAANAHCTSTTCFLRTWYDQSGAGRDWVQSTVAAQPQVIFNCVGALPCLRTTGGQVVQAAAQVSPVGAQSFSVVARVDGAAQGCIWVGAAQERLLAWDGGAYWIADNGGAGGSVTNPATLAVWHAGSTVINGAASVINVDGAETAGTVAVVGTTNNYYGVYGGGGAATCSQTEAIWWNGYGLTAGERVALQANQKSFWGTP